MIYLMDEYIGERARIMKHPDFENAVIKIQRGEEANLTQAQKNAVICLLKPATQNVNLANADHNDENDEDPFIAKIERELKRRKLSHKGVNVSAYIDTRFIYPVGNDV